MNKQFKHIISRTVLICCSLAMLLLLYLYGKDLKNRSNLYHYNEQINKKIALIAEYNLEHPVIVDTTSFVDSAACMSDIEDMSAAPAEMIEESTAAPTEDNDAPSSIEANDEFTNLIKEKEDTLLFEFNQELDHFIEIWQLFKRKSYDHIYSLNIHDYISHYSSYIDLFDSLNSSINVLVDIITLKSMKGCSSSENMNTISSEQLIQLLRYLKDYKEYLDNVIRPTLDSIRTRIKKISNQTMSSSKELKNIFNPIESIKYDYHLYIHIDNLMSCFIDFMIPQK